MASFLCGNALNLHQIIDSAHMIFHQPHSAWQGMSEFVGNLPQNVALPLFLSITSFILCITGQGTPVRRGLFPLTGAAIC